MDRRRRPFSERRWSRRAIAAAFAAVFCAYGRFEHFILQKHSRPFCKIYRGGIDLLKKEIKLGVFARFWSRTNLNLVENAINLSTKVEKSFSTQTPEIPIPIVFTNVHYVTVCRVIAANLR
jgi:hypothetical protein